MSTVGSLLYLLRKCIKITIYDVHVYICISVYFETYGCEMNVSDSDTAQTILLKHGYKRAESLEKVYNCCSFF